MKNYVFFLSICLLIVTSCKEKKQTVTPVITKSDKNIIVNHKPFATVNKASLKKIKNWKEYEQFNDFIKRYEKTSPDEAFDNVAELKELTLALEDSLNIPLFDSPSFKSRLHVLENEVLRLNDMASIPAITTKDVNTQIDKLFLVFGSLNDKINTAFNQEKFEKEINSDDFFTMDKDELLEKETKKTADKKKKIDKKNLSKDKTTQ